MEQIGRLSSNWMLESESGADYGKTLFLVVG